MAAKFELGSIVDIVNSNKKSPKKKNKKVRTNSESPQDESANSVEAEKEETAEQPLVKRGNKRKENIVKNETESVIETPKSIKKKKQRTVNKPDAVASPSDAKEEPEEKPVTDSKQKEKLSRTIFIGNLPANFSLKTLKKTFSQFGSVASIRVRSVAPAKQTLSKKAAYLSKQINPNKKTVNAYLVFHKADSVPKAISLNGTTYDENIIRVDKVEANANYQSTLSVFLGNLSFKVTEDEIRDFFKDCGEITNVRMIRDSKTGIGKGFGYVTFSSTDGVVLALQKSGQEFKGREVRVNSYQYKQPDFKKGKGKKNRKDKADFQKKVKSPNNIAKKGNFANSEKSKKTAPFPSNKVVDFKGEVTSKKMPTKKNMKSRIKSQQANKQKKKIAEILSK